MTSPVDTSVKWFSSAMVNAPVLNGVAGSLVALLTACLRDGFDTKAITSLVAVGGVMTASFVGSHSAQVDGVVLVSGVTGGPTGFAGANGEQKITGRPLATTATWATTLPDGTYTGTITMKIAPAGWITPFTGTNLLALQSNDPASTKCVLRVDDTNAQFARVIGYESMTDINTGIGPFPTAAQISGGGYWAKSTVSSAAAVNWILVADGRVFYFCALPATSSLASTQTGVIRHFGDLVPLRLSGDAFACGLNYSISATTISMGDGCANVTGTVQTAMPRGYTGLGTAVLGAPYAWGGNLGTSGVTGTHGVFPNPVDGAMYMLKKCWTQSATASPRAEYPGLFYIPQSGAWDVIRQGDRVPGAGVLAGRSLLAMSGYAGSAFSTTSGSTNTSVGLVDVTGPWR